MKNEETKVESCGEGGCGRKAPLTIRVEMPDEAQFRIFCKRHFSAAMEFVRALWLEKGVGIVREATWGCGREGCPNRAVVTFRVRTDEGPETMPFCRDHLCIAYEAVAMMYDEEEAA